MKNNSVQLIGTLTRDIELSKNSKGNSFVRFTLACTRDNKPFTDFINCIAFGDLANDICNHGDKDTGFCIVGNLRTSSYEKDGKKQYSTNVVVESFELLND
mgnify:CR=1 FL=1